MSPNPLVSLIFTGRGTAGSMALSMSRSVQLCPHATRLLAAAVSGLVLLGLVACDRNKKTLPAQNQPMPRVAIAHPLPPPAATNAPAKKPPENLTPVDLFQAGLKLWDGKGVTKAPAEAVKLFSKSAEQGNVDAQAYLAGAYRTGVGVPKNPEQAARWFRAAAEHGDARSQGVLASMYGTGEGVAKDNIEAVKWYRLAAEQGLVRAQANLGAMYFLGQGVAADPVEAYKWLHIASLKGDQEAVKNRGLVSKKLSGSQMLEGRKRATEFVPSKAK